MLDLVRPGDRDYPRLRHVYTATGAPAAVARPRTAAEVAEALTLAREAGGPLSVRSGGHGMSSVSTNDGGTVIDLGRLTGIERLPETGLERLPETGLERLPETGPERWSEPGAERSSEPGDGTDGSALVRIGAGNRWGDVAAALRPWGLALSSGDSGDVGVGGLATTGGLGLMGRAHGLTIDHLVAAELVTADGRIRTVDAAHDPDLFWAVRGAGANLGVVTSFTFRADRVPAVVHATVQYQVTDVAAFLQRWGSTVESAPRSVSAFLYLMGHGFALATLVVAGEDPAALAPFLRVAPVLGQRAQLAPYATVVPASHAPHLGQQRARTHSGLAVHLDQPVAEGVAELVGAGFGEMLQIRSAGGAINDVPADATAYAHRHQNFSITAVAAGRPDRFDAAFDRLRPALDGLYLSFESQFTPERLSEAFPPATLERLRAIKATVDPDNVFRQNFPVAAPAVAR